MRLLCRLGIHRWQFAQSYQRNATGNRFEIVEARCKRRCCRYPDWQIVHIERIHG